MTELPMSDPQRDRPGFTPEVLDRTVISIPLLDVLRREDAVLERDPSRPPDVYDVVIDINLEYEGGREAARQRVMDLLDQAITYVAGQSTRRPVPAGQGPNVEKSQLSQQYVFARLQGEAIREAVRLNEVGSRNNVQSQIGHRAIYRIWPDFPIRALLNKSVSTVKADAARAAFSALGEDIVLGGARLRHRGEPPSLQGARKRRSGGVVRTQGLHWHRTADRRSFWARHTCCGHHCWRAAPNERQPDPGREQAPRRVR